MVALGTGLIVAFAGAARADAKSALPPAVAGFKMTKPVVVYSPATLENHIDGEAEAVKRYDFKQCAYAEYAPNGVGNQLITVDVYQFGSPLDAYGYYTGQRNPKAKFLKIGAEAYQESDALNFWKGPYYVKLAITAARSPAAFQAATPKMAAAIAAKLTGPTAVPSIISLLPPGKSPMSERYQKENIAAQSYLKNGVTAQYPAAGPRAELDIMVYPSAGAAKAAFKQYQRYVTRPSNVAVGAAAKPIKGLGAGAIGVKSRYSGEVVAALKGPDIVIVRLAKDPASAQKLAQSALAHLK